MDSQTAILTKLRSESYIALVSLGFLFLFFYSEAPICSVPQNPSYFLSSECDVICCSKVSPDIRVGFCERCSVVPPEDQSCWRSSITSIGNARILWCVEPFHLLLCGKKCIVSPKLCWLGGVDVLETIVEVCVVGCWRWVRCLEIIWYS